MKKPKFNRPLPGDSCYARVCLARFWWDYSGIEVVQDFAARLDSVLVLGTSIVPKLLAI